MPTSRTRLLAALAVMIPTLASAQPLPLGCDVPTMEQMIADAVADLKPCEAPGDGLAAAEIY